MKAKSIITAHIIILIMLCAMILSLHVFVANDYPNHLARMYIYHHIDTSPYLSNFYIKKFELFPYLGMDIFFHIFLNFFNIYTVGKLLICSYMVLIVASVLMLSKTLFHRFETSTFLVYAVIFNANLAWGFLNYSFAIPFVMMTFTSWIALENKNYYQKIVFFILSQLIFFMHIFAFLILMLIITIYELQKNNFKILFNIKNRLFCNSRSRGGFCRQIKRSEAEPSEPLPEKTTATSGVTEEPQMKMILYLLICLIIPAYQYFFKKSSLTLNQGWHQWSNFKSSYHAFLSAFEFSRSYLASLMLLLLIIAYLNKTLILEKNKILVISLLIVIPFCTGSYEWHLGCSYETTSDRRYSFINRLSFPDDKKLANKLDAIFAGNIDSFFDHQSQFIFDKL